MIHKTISIIRNSKDKSVNPIFAIGVAILISLLISSITFLIFIKSDAYDLVRLTHNSSFSTNNDGVSVRNNTPLTVEELNSIKSSISKEIDLMNDGSDFNANELSDAALGL